MVDGRTIEINIGRDGGTIADSEITIGDIGERKESEEHDDSGDDMTQKENGTLKALEKRMEELTNIVESLVIAVKGNHEYNIAGIVQRLLSVESWLRLLMIFLIIILAWLAKLTFS